MKGLLGKVGRLSRRGVGYGIYLVRGVLAPRIGLRVLESAALHRRSRRWLLGCSCFVLATVVGLSLGRYGGAAIGAVVVSLAWAWVGSGERRGIERELRSLAAGSARSPESATRLSDLRLDTRTLAAVESAQGTVGGSVLLGELDNDGRLRPQFGEIPGVPSITDEQFVPRYRFDLTLIARDGQVLIRKDYRGDKAALLREAACLSRLDGTGAAPAVSAIDRKNNTLAKSFVHGPTLRDVLVRVGARILSADTEHDSELTGLDTASRLEAVWKRGQAALDNAHEASEDDLPADLLAALEGALDSVHTRGVTGCSLTFGNVVFRQPGGQPVFIDFDNARLHRQASGLAFDLARDRDRRLFNRIYGTRIETEDSVREKMATVLSTPYAPIDLGRGLVTLGFWSVDSGTGRWEYLNREALVGLIQGQRILDLGTYNGVLSLMMLRSGARAVTAVERNTQMAEAARQLHRILEWRDLRAYDFEMRCADMRAILDENWGSFDVVTAFCSLYYLPEEDMRRVVERARQIAPVLVLQAKNDTRPDAADGKAHKSSQGYLESLLHDAGYPDVLIRTKRGYSRPLLIARRPEGGGGAAPV